MPCRRISPSGTGTNPRTRVVIAKMLFGVYRYIRGRSAINCCATLVYSARRSGMPETRRASSSQPSIWALE